jgi:hypothetical protein
MNKVAVAKELVKIAKSLIAVKPDARIKRRLEYLRKQIEAERISYGEISELESLSEYIDPNDVLLLEWAGFPEKR